MSDDGRAADHRVGLLCLATTTLGWGLNWPAMRVLLRELTPLVSRGIATAIAAIAVVAVASALGQRIVVRRGVLPRLALASALNVFAWMGFGTIAMRWLAVAQCALLVYTMPIWATLFAWPISGRRPDARALAGLALAVAGLWALFSKQALSFDDAQWLGVGFALAAAICFAFGTVALGPLAGIPPLVSLAWQLGIAAVAMLAIGFALETPRFADVTPLGWALMAYMTAVPMGFCYVTWFAALRRLPPSTASIATLGTPVVGVVSATLVLGEPLGAREIAALVLVLGGVALALRRPARMPTVDA